MGSIPRFLPALEGLWGFAFAIPIDVAMEVVEQLKENGSVVRDGWA